MSEKEGRVIKMGGLIPKLLTANELARGFWFGCALAFLSVCIAIVVIKPNLLKGEGGSFTVGPVNEGAGGRWWSRRTGTGHFSFPGLIVKTRNFFSEKNMCLGVAIKKDGKGDNEEEI